jgi:hypothetical protein
MSQTVLFCVGAVIFAIVIYGSVMAGGLALARQERAEETSVASRVSDADPDTRAPRLPRKDAD